VSAARLSYRRGFRKRPDQFVEEGLAFVKRLDAQAFVAAVESNVVAVEENALDSTGRNTRDAKCFPVAGELLFRP
jgi:hypothetical protein